MVVLVGRLGPVERSILEWLADHDGERVTPIGLAVVLYGRTGWHQGGNERQRASMRRALRSLHSKGLVTVSRPGSRRRSVWLTDAGRAVA